MDPMCHGISITQRTTGLVFKKSTINESQQDSTSIFFQPVTLRYVSYISEKSWEGHKLATIYLEMDVWLFPTISYVKIWFIIQLKEAFINGCFSFQLYIYLHI